MANIVDIYDVIEDFIRQLEKMDGDVFFRKKTESLITVDTVAKYDSDVYIEMFLSVMDSDEDSGELLLYSSKDDIYTKNKIIKLADRKGCVLYVEFINPAETGKETNTSIERNGKIIDVGVYAGSALYYLQLENGKLEYCPVMRTDLDLSTSETRVAGELSGMGEMERVEHENYNIYEDRRWNAGFLSGEMLLPNSVQSMLYLKYFGGNQPNPHFHFMTVDGIIPYFEGWGKSLGETNASCVNANAISVDNLKTYLLNLSESMTEKEPDVYQRALQEFNLGLPYLQLIKNNKLEKFKPNFDDLSSSNLMNKLSMFIPNESALSGGNLTFKEKSAISLGVSEYIRDKKSFKEIIESIPEYHEIMAQLKQNEPIYGVNALIMELSLASLFDKLYKVVSVTNFAKVSEQENCKKNIKRIISTCMNDVAMPVGGNRKKSIWDIYDKGFENPNIRVNDI